MKTVVVTGGIGSGKSTVCRILEEDFDWPVYNADQRVKDLYGSHPRLLNDIETVLGENLRDEEGEFVPHRLAARIFSDAQALKKVEDLVFPVLQEDFHHWKKELKDCSFVALESATILEKPSLIGMGDLVVVVDAPVDVRVSRAASRDGADEENIRRRVAAQGLMNAISQGEIPEMVDWVIDNSQDEQSLRMSVGKWVENTMKQKC